ncbi:MAG: hypothetical protein WCB20_14615, partial [Chthoniobacterales bacterium]
MGRELMGGLTNDVRRFWWAVLVIALLTIVTRLPSLLHPQAIDDEETYSVVANVIVDAWLALTIVGFSISHWLGLASERATSETGRYLLE